MSEHHGRSAAEMVNTCFRHQHPEAYGREEIPEPTVPTDLRHGRDPLPTVVAYPVPEEPMGYPGAEPLPV